MLAKRYARGGIRTRNLQHGTVGASYHYTTRSHSNPFTRAHGRRKTKIKKMKKQKDAKSRDLAFEIKIRKIGWPRRELWKMFAIVTDRLTDVTVFSRAVNERLLRRARVS